MVAPAPANVNVPLVVTGLLVTTNADGAAKPTLVTVPPVAGKEDINPFFTSPLSLLSLNQI